MATLSGPLSLVGQGAGVRLIDSTGRDVSDDVFSFSVTWIPGAAAMATVVREDSLAKSKTGLMARLAGWLCVQLYKLPAHWLDVTYPLIERLADINLSGTRYVTRAEMVDVKAVAYTRGPQ